MNIESIKKEIVKCSLEKSRLENDLKFSKVGKSGGDAYSQKSKSFSQIKIEKQERVRKLSIDIEYMKSELQKIEDELNPNRDFYKHNQMNSVWSLSNPSKKA